MNATPYMQALLPHPPYKHCCHTQPTSQGITHVRQQVVDGVAALRARHALLRQRREEQVGALGDAWGWVGSWVGGQVQARARHAEEKLVIV